MPLGKRFLVNSKVLRNPTLLSAKPPVNSLVHDVPGLVPTGASKMIGSGYIAFLQRVNYSVLKEQGESAASLSPGGQNLPNPMLGTFNSGQSTMNVGPKLARIEMAPYPLFAVIIYAYFLLTLGAVPLDTRTALYPDIHSARSRIKLNFAYFPGITEPKQGFIKFRVSDWHPPSKRTPRPPAY